MAAFADALTITFLARPVVDRQTGNGGELSSGPHAQRRSRGGCMMANMMRSRGLPPLHFGAGVEEEGSRRGPSAAPPPEIASPGMLGIHSA